MSHFDYANPDFDDLLRLAQDDPERFEAVRQKTIATYIETLPDDRQDLMRRLQWRIDQERRNRTPLSACIRISSLMWENLLGTQGLLGYMQKVSLGGQADCSAVTGDNNIIEFPLGSS
ncbi:MAG: DUF3135 domain-containing protein [Candidatus Thiodiazotropha sp.]